MSPIFYLLTTLPNIFKYSFVANHSCIINFKNILFVSHISFLMSSFIPIMNMSIERVINFSIFFFCSWERACHSFWICCRTLFSGNAVPHMMSHSSSCFLGMKKFWFKKRSKRGLNEKPKLTRSFLDVRKNPSNLMLVHGLCSFSHFSEMKKSYFLKTLFWRPWNPIRKKEDGVFFQ